MDKREGVPKGSGGAEAGDGSYRGHDWGGPRSGEAACPEERDAGGGLECLA